MPGARGVFLRKITRGATATDIPILPDTKLNRGDIVTLVGRTQDIAAATKTAGLSGPRDRCGRRGVHRRGHRDRRTGRRDRLQGRQRAADAVHVRRRVDSGLFFGWLRSVRPTFGRIPSPTVWFMNSVGLNVFIAIVGISSGPGFVAGLQQLGFGLFLWGVACHDVPLDPGDVCRQIRVPFRRRHRAGLRLRRAHHDRLARHDQRPRQEPDSGLGYTVTYAVGNTLLTIWGMVWSC